MSETDLATPVDPILPTPQANQDTLSSLPEHSHEPVTELSSQQLEIVQASKAILDTIRMRDFPAYKWALVLTVTGATLLVQLHYNMDYKFNSVQD